jgi:hypothetical protein
MKFNYSVSKFNYSVSKFNSTVSNFNSTASSFNSSASNFGSCDSQLLFRQLKIYSGCCKMRFFSFILSVVTEYSWLFRQTY